jgi:hypothetical protein
MRIQCAKLGNTYDIAKHFTAKTYKIPIFRDFIAKSLHIPKKSRTFAPL